MMNTHEGWLKLRTARVECWERRWVTFDGGILSYSAAQSNSEDPRISVDEGATSVHMDQVISLRIDVRYPRVVHVFVDQLELKYG